MNTNTIQIIMMNQNRRDRELDVIDMSSNAEFFLKCKFLYRRNLPLSGCKDFIELHKKNLYDYLR